MNSAIRRQRATIDFSGIAVCTAILLLAYFAAIQPMMRQGTATRACHRQLASQRQRAAAASANVRHLRQKLSQVQALQPHDVLQPAQMGRTTSRLKQITSMAASRGLEIKGVEPGASRQEADYQLMPLRLTGTGNYRGCVAFLHDLRTTLHDTTVTGLRLSGAPDAPGAPVTFDFDLCWYAAPLVASSQE
jgi:Tfp pilus assembly protein PilO